jgi:hypothetical protein
MKLKLGKLKFNMEKLIWKICWGYSKRTKIEINELYQEAYLAYLGALKTYNPEKGALSTHVYYAILSKLSHYYQKEVVFKRSKKEIIKSKPNFNSYSLFEKVTKDVFEAINILFSYDHTKLSTINKNSAKTKIKGILIENGWEEKQIKTTLKNFQLIFT